MNNKKVSFDAIMFALSYWLIFITFEGSFSVQVLFPILILMIIYKIFIDNNIKVKMDKGKRTLFYFIVALFISTITNLIINIKYFNINTIIGLLYFVIIFLWYIVTTNKVY